jgi:hypothetical protein
MLASVKKPWEFDRVMENFHKAMKQYHNEHSYECNLGPWLTMEYKKIRLVEIQQQLEKLPLATLDVIEHHARHTEP